MHSLIPYLNACPKAIGKHFLYAIIELGHLGTNNSIGICQKTLATTFTLIVYSYTLIKDIHFICKNNANSSGRLML